ncbi:MAG: helicase-related protein [Anaerolineae bacterium]
MLNLLEKALNSKGLTYIRIDGSIQRRQALIDVFNQGKREVALCSLGATSHGINLTSANHVIHADRWWNPAIEDQATDRVHRIGQSKTVYVYRIIVRGTLEERIDSLLATKRRIAGQIIDAATKGPHKWSRDELLELLRPLD